MKISKTKLQQIISEELQAMLSEGPFTNWAKKERELAGSERDAFKTHSKQFANQVVPRERKPEKELPSEIDGKPVKWFDFEGDGRKQPVFLEDLPSLGITNPKEYASDEELEDAIIAATKKRAT
jgi:hypothetical protein